MHTIDLVQEINYVCYYTLFATLLFYILTIYILKALVKKVIDV